MTRIEIAADQWAEWPDAAGWYLFGKQGEESQFGRLSYPVGEHDQDCVYMSLSEFHVRNCWRRDGWKFYRIPLPTVPSIRS